MNNLFNKDFLFKKVQQLFKFVKNLYSEIPRRMNSIFNYKATVKVPYLNSLNLDHALRETFTSYQIMTDTKQIVNKLSSNNFIKKEK